MDMQNKLNKHLKNSQETFELFWAFACLDRKPASSTSVNLQCLREEMAHLVTMFLWSQVNGCPVSETVVQLRERPPSSLTCASEWQLFVIICLWTSLS